MHTDSKAPAPVCPPEIEGTAPLKSYHFPPGITAAHVALSANGAGDRTAALAELSRYVKAKKADFLGYQASQELDNKHLVEYLDASINNIGDSFADPRPSGAGFPDGYFTVHCKWMERAVLDYFAKLWHAGAPRRVKEDGEGWETSYWGYVLSMGCTEGNLMALRSARDYLKGRQLLYERNKPVLDGMGYVEPDGDAASAKPPKLLYSKASHYSIKKLAQMLELDAELVDVDEHGRIDLDDLEKKAKALLDQKIPIVVNFNYGTTFTGGLDDVEAAIARIRPHILDNGMERRTFTHVDEQGRTFTCERKGYWFHVDGALGAGHASYCTQDGGFTYPRFDFRLDIQSLAMSGHKWPGAPWPTGIFMTQNRYMMSNDVPAYVGSLDSTLAGSRSGIASIFLWDWIARSTDAKRKAQVEEQLTNARSLEAALTEQGWKAKRAPGSVAVVFTSPNDAILRKYAIPKDGAGRAHILCMPHVTWKLLEQFLKELGRPTDDEPSVDADSGLRGTW